VFQPLIESFVPFGIATRRVFCFQSIPKLSKSAFFYRFLSFPPMNDFKHPDMLLLTFLSIPICCHSFQTRQFWYCYHLHEFFIPSMYCYIVRIPELLLLTSHSFLANDRISSKPVSIGIATIFTNSSSPSCIATWLEFLRYYC